MFVRKSANASTLPMRIHRQVVMGGDFLHRRHEGYQTPRSVLEQIVRDVMGDTLATRDAVTVGYANEVYRVVTQAGAAIVVRIARHGGVRFREEAWALDQCRRAGVPVPQVYGVRAIEDGPARADVMVMQHLPGEALGDVYPSLSEQRQQDIMSELGGLLRAMHAVPVAAFGLLAPGPGGMTRWGDYVRQVVADRVADVPYLIDAGLTEREAHAIVAVVEGLAAFHHPHPVLCMGISAWTTCSSMRDASAGSSISGWPKVVRASWTLPSGRCITRTSRSPPSCPGMVMRVLPRRRGNENASHTRSTRPPRTSRTTCGMATTMCVI